MDSGIEFLRDRIDNAVVQHGEFVQALLDHEAQAQDERFRELCARHLTRMREHQRMLEEYQGELNAQANENVLEGVAERVRRAAGTAFSHAKELADAPRSSDFNRLISDLMLARQGEDTFKLFRDGGRFLGIQRLAEIGEIGERDHDAYVAEARRLAQQLFVERARGAEHLVMRRPEAGPGSTR
jgi:hypothetical protein